MLYNRHLSLVHEPIRTALSAPGWGGPVEGWPAFLADFDEYLRFPNPSLPSRLRPEHLFAVFFQIAPGVSRDLRGHCRRLSASTAQLRAAVWQSIFTHDMRRYMRTLYRHMVDIPTLITGPSGSGKELVARAVGQSLYTLSSTLPDDGLPRTAIPRSTCPPSRRP